MCKPFDPLDIALAVRVNLGFSFAGITTGSLLFLVLNLETEPFRRSQKNRSHDNSVYAYVHCDVNIDNWPMTSTAL